MKQAVIKPKIQSAVSLNLNLNFRMFGFAGLILIIYYAFLSRGLYFKPELLVGLIMIAVVFVFALGDAIIRGQTDLYCFPIDYVVTATALAYLLSVIGAVSKPDAILGALKYFGYLLVYFITCQVVKTWRGYRIVLEMIFFGAIMVALIGLFSAAEYLRFPGAYASESILSTFQYSNALAIFLVVVSFLSLSLWVSGERAPLKDLWYVGGLLLLNITLLGTQSRTVWIMFPVLLLVWLMGLPKNRRTQTFFGISYILMAAVLISRGFLSRVNAGAGNQAMMLLLGGVLVTLAGWLAMHRANRIIKGKKTADAVKKFWQGLGLVYLTLVLVVYAVYTVKSLPGGWDEVVPTAVTQQMGTVTGYDNSFQARFIFSKDALPIVKDYPLTGAGAGGWKALYHKYQSLPYTSSEIHNGFLQVMVESGIPGFLVYTAIWVLAFYYAYRLFRHFRGKERYWPLTWGAAVALLAMALHSSFDFDLSLPTLSILTWILFALLRNGRQLAHHREEGIPLGSGRRVVLLILGTALALTAIIPSYRLYQSGNIGADGAEAMAAGDIALAEGKLQTAAVTDWFSGSYSADLAKINLVYWLKDGDAERLKQGILMAEQAVQKEPFNLELRANLVTTYLTAGMNNEAIVQAEQLAAANPFEIKAYEVLAGAGVNGALYYKRNGSVSRALVYLNKVEQIPVTLDKKIKEVAKVSGKAYRYDGLLAMTPPLNLAVGQAYLLTQRSVEAAVFLEKAVKDEKVGEEAAAWLAAAYRAAGDNGKAVKLMKTRSEKNQDFKPLYDQVENILQK